ncbi:MAG: secretin N-terminal domain-containing protein [Rhodocyclaceae bacterium]
MKRVLALVVLFAAGLALAQEGMEILVLRHRQAEQVIPALTPLLEKGGSLSGMSGRIIVRSSARNMEEIRRALAAIDTPVRRLMISVKQDNAGEGRDGGAEVSGSVGSLRMAKPAPRAPEAPGLEVRGGQARARVYSSRGRAEERMTQQVQTVEGAGAFIELGYSFPLPLRQVVTGAQGSVVTESVVYRDLGSGFYARPTLIGDRVTIEIAPRQESLSSVVAGAVHSQRLSTTVSGRLGEWIALGGTSGAEERRDSGVTSYSTRGSLENRRVLLKVEEIPD